MTGFLYFLGNTLRWPVLKPKEFFSLHAYFSIIYLITFTLSKYDVSQSNLVFTLGNDVTEVIVTYPKFMYVIV